MTQPPTTEALSPDQTSALLHELEGASLEQIAQTFEGQGPPATTGEHVSTTAPTEQPPAPAEPAAPAAPAAPLDPMEALEAELSEMPPFQQASRRFTLMVAAIFTGLFEGSAAMLPSSAQTPAALSTVRDRTLDLVALSVLHALSSTLQSEGFTIDRLSSLLFEASTTPAEVLEERYLPFFEALKKLQASAPAAAPVEPQTQSAAQP
jgi:hypothetical protein